jgi:hypothetical protein
MCSLSLWCKKWRYYEGMGCRCSIHSKRRISYVEPLSLSLPMITPRCLLCQDRSKEKTWYLVHLDCTSLVYLNASKKTIYLRYQCFLKTTHRDHSEMFFKLYDEKLENESTPERSQNREHVFQMVKIYISSLERRIWLGQKEIEHTSWRFSRKQTLRTLWWWKSIYKIQVNIVIYGSVLLPPS